MSIGEIIYKIFIGPLEMFFEVVFSIANRHVSNPAYAIIVLSLAMNFLVLPLYRRADALQAEERDRENALAPWIRHIKKTFKGDERFMMLQAYYRENNYKPTDSLKGSVSLFLEIPFFIAAYHFLSHLETLKGVAFGPIADLGAPDALINLGAVTINLLPILMTLINVISAAIYMKGFPLKSKIQMYGIAAIFLVFLYKSPAGLVFYWTLNNIFSLVKNIFYKLKDPAKVLRYLSSIAGAVMLVFVLLKHPMGTNKAQAVVVCALLAMQLPLILHGRKISISFPASKQMSGVFYGASIILTVLTGMLIPSAVINDSTQEFIDLANYVSPFWYIAGALAMAVGTFLVWFGVFYRLSSEKGKQLFTVLMFAGACCALANYMFFGKNYGNFSSMLTYDTNPSNSNMNVLLNLLVLMILTVVVAVAIIRKSDVVKLVSGVLVVSLLIMSGINIVGINSTLKDSEDTIKAAVASTPEIRLSKNNRNVVVIMMDRQIGHYIPFIFNEKPELRESFEGFTCYQNSFSYGTFTNVGSPGLYGGYEYIPSEMNKRDGEKLKDKHNEAIKVMPKMFSDAGYDVNFINPTYAGYSWIPDLSVLDDIDNMTCSITNGKFALEEYGYIPQGIKQAEIRQRNFFCYSIFKAAPLLLQPYLYNKGDYNEAKGDEIPMEQTISDINTADGYSSVFMDSYAALSNMSNMTKISETEKGSLNIMSNDVTHSEMMLQEPDYIPAAHVENQNSGRTRMDKEGNELLFTDNYQVRHYQINMAAMLKIAEWLDYLKDNGVYDNTRIIIVSDHGRDLNDNVCPLIEYRGENGEQKTMDSSFFDSVLLEKDFDSHEMKSDMNLISNAEVPYMATEGLFENPTNPYTGNELKTFTSVKGQPELIYTFDYQTDKNNGNVFLPADWFTVTERIYNTKAWEYLGHH